MQIFDVLVVLWWSSALGGGVALLVGVLVPRHRRQALITAAVLFSVAGVLGILSVGLLFVVAAVVCGVWAARTTTVPR